MNLRADIAQAFRERARTIDPDVLDELEEHARALHDSTRARGGASEADAAVRRQIAAWADNPEGFTRRLVRRPLPSPPPVQARNPLDGFLQDVRYGARLLARQPGHTLTAVLTIGLGLAAVITVSGFVRAVLRPLPWPEPDRLVRVYETRGGNHTKFGRNVTNAAYRAWNDRPASIEHLAGWTMTTKTLSAPGSPERVAISSATSSLAAVLRARPSLGRWLVPADEAGRGERVVVLSHGLWQERFGGRADAVGRAVTLDGEPYTVVGVMPPDFGFPARGTRAWVPLPIPPLVDPLSDSTVTMFNAIARLGPGVTIEQAASEATIRTRAALAPNGPAAPALGMLAIAIFGSDGRPGVSLVPALDAAIGDTRPALIVLLAAVGLLLATAAANVANLQLARTSSRRREFAIRAALGAATGRLGRQLMTENLLLGALGGGVGLAIAFGLHPVLRARLPESFPRVDEMTLDWPWAAAITVLVSVGASLGIGALPALVARRVNQVQALNEDGAAPSGSGLRLRTSRARALVMVAQVAVATVLLVSATLLTTGFITLLETDRGFDAAGVLTAAVPLPSDTADARKAAVLETIVDRLRHVPGVSAAGFTTILPLTGTDSVRAFSMKSPRGEGMLDVRTSMPIVSSDYFAALGMRIVEGRGLTAADTATSERVVVVNRQFARQYLGDRPLGAGVPLGSADSRPSEDPIEYRVVGVVDDVRPADGSSGRPEAFVSYKQWGRLHGGDPMLVVRTHDDPITLGPVLRGIVGDVAPDVALASMMTMDERLLQQLATPRLYALVLDAFAAAALIIATVGLFSVVSYTVAQRSRELAIRSALGASPGRLFGMVLTQAVSLVAVGLAIGTIAAASSSSVLSSLLYGLTPNEVTSYAMVAALLLCVALAACAIPARRAARLEPLRGLRGE